MNPKLLFAVSALLLAPASAFQSVHVVNGGPAGALQAAIDAAASGDTVLVHGGSFGAISIQSKSITLIAEPANGTTVSALAISGLAPGNRCTVAGLNVDPAPVSAAVTVIGCAGSVRLQDVQVTGGLNTSVDALVVANSSNVACMRCLFVGGSQVPVPGPNPTPSFLPGRGVVCQGSQLALYTCGVSGGAGQNDHFINQVFASSGAGEGGAGLHADSGSTVFAARSAFLGGNGGFGRSLACVAIPCGIGPTSGANGGTGFFAEPGASASMLDCVFGGGSGGPGGAGGQCCPQTTFPPGSNGSAGAASQGAITQFTGTATRLDAPSAVRVGNMLPLTIHGTPGDVIFLAVSSQTRFVFDPFYSGVFLFGPAARRSSFGVIPGSGVLDVSIPVGSLPAGAQSAVRYLQVLARDPMGQLRLGAASVVTVLDPSF